MSKVKVISEDMLIEGFCETVGSETYKILKSWALARKVSPDKAVTTFVKTLVRTSVENVFVRHEEGSVIRTDQEVLSLTKADYSNLKFLLENAIADAYTSALSSKAKQPTDYYCDIGVTGDPVNKEPA